MLRAFQSGPVAKQFGKLVGRGGASVGVRGAADGAMEDISFEGVDEEQGMDEGVPGAEGFSAADRLLGAVSERSRGEYPGAVVVGYGLRLRIGCLEL